MGGDRVTVSYVEVFWLLYGVALLALVGGCVSFLPRRTSRFALPLLAVALSCLVGALFVRSLIAGRLPVIGTFENTMVAAAMIVMTALVCALWGPPLKRPSLAELIAPWAVLVLAGGLFAPLAPIPIDAGGRTLIGYVHAFVGWLDFAVMVGTLAASIGLLINTVNADENAWDESLSRLLGLGFALLTATMASGSIYSYLLFGEWYRWQLVESAAALAWLSYAALLHLRLLHRWRGRRLAYAVLAAFPLAVIAFWVWAIYPNTYHYFDAVLRTR